MTGLNEIIGAPFLEGGRDPNAGIDCLGVGILVARHHGVPIVDPWDRLRESYTRTSELSGHVPAGWVEVSQPGDGDLILTPGHVAAYSHGYVYSAAKPAGGFREIYSRFRARHRHQMSIWRWEGERE